jgi:hypothetical protein
MSKRLTMPLVATGLALVGLNTIAFAGGWSVATLDDWPTQVVANQPFTISYSLRQHGVRLFRNQFGSAIFEQPEQGGSPLTFEAGPTFGEGHYKATITLPSAGQWQWQLDAFGHHAMPPITVHAGPPPAGQAFEIPQPATLGRILFVAKGCSSCHRHEALPGGYSIGPPLPDRTLTAEFLRQWLGDPKSLLPTARMPNLGMQPGEIEALTAFLMSDQQS